MCCWRSSSPTSRRWTGGSPGTVARSGSRNIQSLLGWRTGIGSAGRDVILLHDDNTAAPDAASGLRTQIADALGQLLQRESNLVNPGAL